MQKMLDQLWNDYYRTKENIGVDAVQLTWETWSQVCSLIPFHQFGGGVWVKPDTGEYTSVAPLETPADELQIGLLIRNKPESSVKYRLIREGMWIVRDRLTMKLYFLDNDVFHFLFKKMNRPQDNLPF